MNAYNLAKTAYSNPSTPTRTPRGTEYDAFAKITHRLKSFSTTNTGFSELANALHENVKLWTILAADVADGNNTLPDALCGRIFYLYEFTSQHTSKVLRGEDSVDVLVDINTAVMGGLRRREGV